MSVTFLFYCFHYFRATPVPCNRVLKFSYNIKIEQTEAVVETSMRGVLHPILDKISIVHCSILKQNHAWVLISVLKQMLKTWQDFIRREQWWAKIDAQNVHVCLQAIAKTCMFHNCFCDYTHTHSTADFKSTHELAMHPCQFEFQTRCSSKVDCK